MSRLLLFNGAAGFGSLFARHVGGGGALPGAASYSLTADPAAYSLTGQTVAVRAGRVVVAEAASFVLAAAPAFPLTARRVAADTALYALTGNDATLTYTPVGAGFGGLLARGLGGAGSVEIIGFGSLLARGLGGGGAVGGVFSVAADGTSYVWTAAPALRDFAVTAEPTSYALGAQDVDLRAGRRVVAEAAAYVLTARDAGLLTDDQFAVIAEPAAYLLTGAPAGLRTGRRLTAPSLTYVFAPSSAQLRWGRLIGGARRTIKVNASRSRVRAQGGRRSTEVG